MNKRKNNNSPLKIAVLGHKTIPSRQGGIEIVVEELTVRMAKLGHKITVYNRSGHHVSGKEFDGKKLKEYKGIRMKYVPTIDKKGLAAMPQPTKAIISNEQKSGIRKGSNRASTGKVGALLLSVYIV